MYNFFSFSIALLLSLLFFSTDSIAGEIKVNAGKTELKFLSGNYRQLSFTASISSVQFRDISTKKGEFTELFVNGYGSGSMVGDPSLPTYRKLIEVPLNCTFTITITGEEYKEYDLAASGINHAIIPSQPSVSKGITNPDLIPFEFNETTYRRNEFLGAPGVAVSDAGIMRSVRLARIDIAPFRYNPVTGKLRVYEKIEATVHFADADSVSTLMLRRQKASRYFEGLYRQLGNYLPVTDTLITAAPVTYVIVSPPAYHAALQPFVKWKIKKGFRVIQAYTSDPEVGNTTTSIKNFLHGLYDNPPSGCSSPSFVLFVGDVGQIPAFTNNGQPTDLGYCEYTNDNLPEVFYGRFSANNLTQLQPYIDKVLEYERCQFPSETWLNEVVMVAGADAAHQMTWGNGQITYGTTHYFNIAHNLSSHTYLQPEPAGANYSLQIRTEVSNGVSYANYTAHGSESGWADPQFSISQIPTLQNDHKYCLMVGNCCLTSKFDVTCFAEEITRAAHKGAIGYIGAANNTYWDEDYWWGCGFKGISANPEYNPHHLGAYDATFHDQGESIDHWYTTMGQMVVGGNMAVEESGTAASIKRYYWEIYNLMGDPSVSIYYSAPPALAATYPAAAIVGTTSLEVNTEPWAYVALSKNDTLLLDAKCADSTGLVYLTFSLLSEPGVLSIVITKQNRKPVIDSIQVIQARGAYLTSGIVTVNDSIGGNHNRKADYSESIRLNIPVSNVGTLPAADVTGTISTSDTNIFITSASFNLGTLPPGGTYVYQDAFGLTVKDFVTDQHKVHFTVLFTDGTNSWGNTFLLTINAPSITIGQVTVLDPAPGGNNNGILDPGECAQLKIITANTGHAEAVNGAGHLLVPPGATPFILTTNPNYYLGNIPANGVDSVLFDVVSNGITPPGTLVGLNYTASAGQLNQYTAEKLIDLTLGQGPQFTMSNAAVNTCNGTFFDSGGPAGNYSDNEAYTMTFYPGTAGAMLKVSFTDFNVEPHINCSYDYLSIYNGSSAMAPLLGTYCGTNSPGEINATSSDGALTFEFRSDYADNFPGWEANLSCAGGPLNIIANAFPATVCQGSPSQLVAVVTGGTGSYTYQWTPATYLDDPSVANPIALPETNITYTVTISDSAGNLTSNPIALTLVPKPASPVISENGVTLLSDIALGNRWYLNGNIIPDASSQIYSPSSSGVYFATQTDPLSGCESMHSNSIYFEVTGSEEYMASGVVSVFPNPFCDVLHIKYKLPAERKIKITLMDSYGKVLNDLRWGELRGSHTLTISTSDLRPGMYYCKIQTDSTNYVKKIILSR